MSNITKKTALIISLSCLIILFTISGCDSQREYNDDILIPLKEHQAEIVIREWSFLLGSGAEVYYRDENKDILLGNLLGGDDGFCPFQEGLYEVMFDDNQLTIEWCRFPNNERDSWETKTFELPTN